MKPHIFIVGFLCLAIFLVGLIACTGIQPDEKLVKSSAPAALPVEVGSPSPTFTEVAQPTSASDCTETNPHPIGQSIAETYEVPYEQVMGWFCQGYSFENILIALETSEAVDLPPDALLEMLLEKDWEQIWDEVGLTSPP